MLPKVKVPQMPHETLVRMAGIATDLVDPYTNIHRGTRDGSCASCVDTAMEGGSRKTCSVSDFNLKPPVSERCSAQDTSTRRTCKVKYKRMPVKTRGRELKEERDEDPSKSKWVLFHE